MKITNTACLFTLLLITASGYAQTVEKGLKDYYKDYFPIGVAVSPQVLKGEEAQLILKHFNSITAENAMKIGPIHPEEDRFHWHRPARGLAHRVRRGQEPAQTRTSPGGCPRREARFPAGSLAARRATRGAARRDFDRGQARSRLPPAYGAHSAEASGFSARDQRFRSLTPAPPGTSSTARPISD
jgi:hypothetical protein